MDNQKSIRNFAIIAHIDHGKSTLADRLMEMTGTVTKREMQDQLLDSNPIERERGITIKLAPVRMEYLKLDDRKSKVGVEDRGLKIEKNRDPSSTIYPQPLSSMLDHPVQEEFILNLIDTPGHVDFTYEVSRSLAACEGAVLVVDASQGVQAQTLANFHLAREHNLKVIPVINKIDLPNARIEETRQEMYELGFTNEDIIEISAKTGKNVEKILEAIVERIPCPQGVQDASTRALIFSSQYDPHKGVVIFVRVVDGSFTLKGETEIRFLNSGATVAPIEIGYFAPKMESSDGLDTGDVGYIATGLKDVRLAKVGDTITTEVSQVSQVSKVSNVLREAKIDTSDTSDTFDTLKTPLQPLAGYHEPKPMVFVGLFPIEQDEFTKSREAMEKLRLSDSAFSFRPIASLALGNGFHCGFLGLLHAEVVQERLSREFNLSLLATAPSVEYQVRLKAGVNPGKAGLHSFVIPEARSAIRDPDRFSEAQGDSGSEAGMTGKNVFSITSPSEFPDPSLIEEVKEPIMQVTIYAPKQYVGNVMQLSQEKRGEYIDMVYHGENAEFTYLIPLSDMIVDFFDRLKSVTEGYASLDYEFFEYQPADVIKVDILVNHEKVDALSFLIVKDQARRRGKEIVDRLADVLPRQQFSIPVQAAIGGDIVARADIKPFRKDVIAKLYGGDRTRKDKLLKKQKKGKEKMKRVGSIEIPQTAFFDVLKQR